MSELPTMKIGDIIYENSYGNNNFLCPLKVTRLTKTQIILDNGVKLRLPPYKSCSSEDTYGFNTIGKRLWNSTSYRLSNDKYNKQYQHEQLYLKTKKKLEEIKLINLADEKLIILFETLCEITCT